jgi:RNA polymerase sigma-70 factor (ECF subfamily)
MDCSMSLSVTTVGRALIETDETALEARFARGDAAAIEEVIALYQSRVVRLAHRLLGWNGDVDDLVQDVFLSAVSKASTFRGDASLWTWLTAITLNHCRSRLRREGVIRRLKLALLGLPKKPESAADQTPLAEEASQQVRKAVAALPSRDREVIVLFYLEQRKTGEIADMLRVSANAVDVRLHRARQKLKVTLAGWAGD